MVFYPGVPDVSAAAPIDASAAGDIRDMNFAIGKAAGHFVRGRVSNPVKGQGERMVSMQLVRDNRAVPPLLVHLPDGADAFEFSAVLPGSYTVLVEWLEGDDRFTARQPVVVGNSDLEGLKVTVAKGPRLPGLFASGAATHYRQESCAFSSSRWNSRPVRRLRRP